MPVEAALLLAGGESRRMGRDKVALPFGEATLAAWVYGRLQAVFPQVVVVTNRPATFPVREARMVGDRHPGRGPLEGLASGLSALDTDRSLLIACDMPFVETALLTYMAGLPDTAAAIVLEGSDGPEPLLGVYARRLLPALDAFLAAGGRGVREFLVTVDAHVIPEADWRPHDPAGRAFWNLNRPEDYALARDLLASRDAGG